MKQPILAVAILAVMSVAGLPPPLVAGSDSSQEQIEVCVALLKAVPDVAGAAAAIGDAAITVENMELRELLNAMAESRPVGNQIYAAAGYFRSMGQAAQANLHRAAGCPAIAATPDRTIASVRMDKTLPPLPGYRRLPVARCTAIAAAITALEIRSYQFAVAVVGMQLAAYNDAHVGTLRWAEIDAMIRRLEARSPWSYNAPEFEAPLRALRDQIAKLTSCSLPPPVVP